MAHRCPDCTLNCDCTPGDVVSWNCVHCDEGRAELDVIEDDEFEDDDDEDEDEDED